MIKSTFRILALAIFGLTFTSKAQQFQWVKQMTGGGSNDISRSITLDDSGNIYTTGSFAFTVDFDPGPDVYNLVASGGAFAGNEIFISKLDADGNFVWAKQFGGVDGELGLNIAVDDSGNVYIVGRFSATADFDPGPSTFNLSVVGYIDMFVTKLDASGNFVWAKQIGGTGFDEANAIAIDNSGNVYVSGFFNQTADFDPGEGTFNLTSAGGSDIFLLKLDPAGNFIWAKQTGGSTIDESLSMVLDNSGYVYTSGKFSGTVDFDSNAGTYNLTSAASSSMFISKQDTDGNLIWAKVLGSNSVDMVRSMTVDGLGNVYSTGSYGADIFSGIADFDPGEETFNLVPVGLRDVFISKLDSDGNFVWAKQMGSINITNDSYCIRTDASGNVFTCGEFQGSVDFDPGVGTYTLTTQVIDIFISKLDADGNFISAMQVGGTDVCLPYSLALDNTGSIYTTGVFNGTADFNPGSDVFNLITSGLSDIFILKLDGDITTKLTDSKVNKSIIVYPNPTSDFVIIKNSSDKNSIASIFDVSGKLISNFNVSRGENLISLKDYTSGIYFLLLNDGESVTRIKIVLN